jgi:nicotinate-nucleotide adenylyltransferase
LDKLFKKNTSVGILGGTFDPPHIGHLHISKVALKKLKLNKLIWLITKKNPLKKKPYLKLKTRIKLSKSITKKETKILVLHLDNKIKSNSTFDILTFIKKKNKKIKIFFLMGADNLEKLHKWKNWKKLHKLAKIVVFPRKNYLNKINEYTMSKTLKKNQLIYIKSKKVNISSSLIRKFW